MTEISNITDPPGNLRITKTINKESLDQLAHIDKVTNNEIIDPPAHTGKTINQIDNQAPTEAMIIEIDQIVQTGTNIDPIISITDHHLRTTDKITETIPHITVNSKTNNIREMIEEEAIHPYHLQFNQEPIVDQTTEDL